MAKELKNKYNSKEVEQGKYEFWLEGGFFKSGDKSKKPYSIVIPPPNVTGKLHLGHAWDNTLQDIIIRRKRPIVVVIKNWLYSIIKQNVINIY